MLVYYAFLRGIITVSTVAFLSVFSFLTFNSILPSLLIFAVLAADYFSTPAVSNFLYRRGAIKFAAVNLYWNIKISVSGNTDLKKAELAWMLLDIKENKEAMDVLLDISVQYNGKNIQSILPDHALSLAKYYLFTEEGNPRDIENLANHAFLHEQNAKTWFIRGLLLLKIKKNTKHAIYMLEKARIALHKDDDGILAGFIYHCLGKAWFDLGEADYASDQLMKAKIYSPFTEILNL